MSQTVAEILVDQMVGVGIRNVYGIVGDSANPIVDAMRRHTADINFVHVRNEEAGAFAAGADAQVSGRPAAVLGSSGPGSVHLLNGLYDCQRNGSPVFAIATHIPSTEIGTGYFQETDPMGMLRGCCNYIATISTPAQMPRLSQLALQAAILERGVGIVILPGDIAAAKVDAPLLEHSVVTGRPVARPTDAALDSARDMIESAKQVVIYGGEGTRAGTRRGAGALGHAEGAGRLCVSRQGRARARQPRGGRDDRAPRLGRRDRGAREVRPDDHARQRLPIPGLHPGRR